MFKALFSGNKSTIQQMSPTELKERLNKKEPLIMLDVRTPEEYKHEGHIAGARLMPLAVVPVRSNELPHDTPIVCVCRSGSRSQVACESLRRQGFTNVANMSGGMMAWRRAGLPTA